VHVGLGLKALETAATGGPPVSVEAAHRLYERTRTDPDFLFRIALLEDPDERAALLAAEGFDCTPEEMAEVFMRPFARPSGLPSSREGA
jgi:predicted ribosomally synthesized peptide with nif11-like leader